MSRYTKIQNDLVSLTKAETSTAKVELTIIKDRTAIFSAGIKLCKDPKKAGLSEVIKMIFSGDVKLIPPAIQDILDAKRRKDLKDGEELTFEGIVKQRWMTCIAEIKSGKTGPEKKDFWQKLEDMIGEAVEKDTAKLEGILEEHGFVKLPEEEE
jgi:hypothetical protein